MKDLEEVYSLMVKKLAGEIGPAEDKILDQWLLSDDANRKTFDDLAKIWNNAQREPLQADTDAAWARVERKIAPKTFRLLSATTLRIAAAIALFAVLGTWAARSLFTSTTTIYTAANEIKKVELPDGSQVWIHEHSSLSYTNHLEGRSRKLELNGLAFFDVKRNEEKPFIITTPRGAVEVLGTSFEVSAYQTDTFERVTVSTGKVKFSAGNEKPMILEANTEGLIGKSGLTQRKTVDSEQLLSWTTSKLVFDNEPMDTIAIKLERHFHVKVHIANPGIRSCRFTASFDKPVLNDVLNALSKALQLTYKKTGDRIILDGKGCLTDN